MHVPRKDDKLNDYLTVLDERFINAPEGPDKFRYAWDALRPDELDFISDQIYRCKYDVLFYLQNYHVIKDEHGVAQAMHSLWDHQIFLYEIMQREWQTHGTYRLIVLKPRQCGGTVFASGVIFHATQFFERSFSMMMAQGKRTTAEIYRRIWDAYNSLPWWLRAERESKQQEVHIVFQREDEKERMVDPGLGSTLLISNAQEQAGVAIGRTIMNFHGSEVSRWPDSDIWTADIEPSMNARNTRAFLESTAFGRSGLFWNMWNAAESGESEWTPVFIPVYRVRKYFTPVYKSDGFKLTPDESILRTNVKEKENFTIPLGFFKWRRKKIQAAINAKGTDEAHYESYPVTSLEAFITSGFCAFPRPKLKEQARLYAKDPEWIGEIEYTAPDQEPILRLHKPTPEELLKKPKRENRLWLWEKPDENTAVEYYLSADVASGDGRDYSDATVYRIGYGTEPSVQVAEWHGLINASHFARVIAALGFWYHGCEVAVEYAQAGITTGDELRWVIDYPNLYRWKHLDKVTGSLTQHIHWVTNSRTREDMINRMGEALLDKMIIIRNRHALNEMMDFGRYEGEIKAAGIDNNDDMAVTHCINVCALHQSGKRQEWAEQQLGSDGSRHSHLLPQSPKLYAVYDAWNRQVSDSQYDNREAADKFIAMAESKFKMQLKSQWRIVEIPVMKANTVWSPSYDSTGAEHELATIHNVSPRDQMLQPQIVSDYRRLMTIEARGGAGQPPLEELPEDVYGED